MARSPWDPPADPSRTQDDRAPRFPAWARFPIRVVGAGASFTAYFKFAHVTRLQRITPDTHARSLTHTQARTHSNRLLRSHCNDVGVGMWSPCGSHFRSNLPCVLSHTYSSCDVSVRWLCHTDATGDVARIACSDHCHGEHGIAGGRCRSATQDYQGALHGPHSLSRRPLRPVPFCAAFRDTFIVIGVGILWRGVMYNLVGHSALWQWIGGAGEHLMMP